MNNLHLLPTDKPSKLAILHNGNLHIGTNFKKDLNVNPQNIYITSDERIKKGDYVLDDLLDFIVKIQNQTELFTAYSWRKNVKKIILTTDADLIADGIQAIDDNFLEWFVKNPNYNSFEITTYNVKGDISGRLYYKIIIPQEKPKEVTAESIIQKTANSLGKSIPETFEVMENFSKDLDKLKEEHKEVKLEEEAELLAKKRVDLNPIYAEGLYYGFIECSKSKWFKTEIIKSKLELIELLEDINKRFDVSEEIKILEQQIKELQNGNT